jgi:hypothetical protein
MATCLIFNALGQKTGHKLVKTGPDRLGPVFCGLGAVQSGFWMHWDFGGPV